MCKVSNMCSNDAFFVPNHVDPAENIGPAQDKTGGDKVITLKRPSLRPLCK